MRMRDKDRVFQILCDHYCSIMDGWIPYPSTCIAGSTGWRLAYVRKLLKELKKEGLIDSIGGLADAIECLYDMIEQQQNQLKNAERHFT